MFSALLRLMNDNIRFGYLSIARVYRVSYLLNFLVLRIVLCRCFTYLLSGLSKITELRRVECSGWTDYTSCFACSRG